MSDVAICPDCDGIGWYRPGDDPRGPVRACSTCAETPTCVPARFRRARTRDLSGTAATAASQWADAPGSVWVWGPPGTGKSHWAAAVVRAAEARGRRCRWYSHRALYDLVRQAQSEGRAGPADVLSGADAVVLDDLLAGRWHDWRAETIEDLVRWAWDMEAPSLIITSNDRPDAAVRRFSAPIQSRIADLFSDLPIGGRDRRGGMKSLVGAQHRPRAREL